MVAGLNLVSNLLDGNGVTTMPGSISVPNSGLFENKEKKYIQMGHANNEY
jgi:hypothetical protein